MPNPQSLPVLCIYCEDRSAVLFRHSAWLLDTIVPAAKDTLEWEEIPRTTVLEASTSIGRPFPVTERDFF